MIRVVTRKKCGCEGYRLGRESGLGGGRRGSRVCARLCWGLPSAVRSETVPSVRVWRQRRSSRVSEPVCSRIQLPPRSSSSSLLIGLPVFTCFSKSEPDLSLLRIVLQAYSYIYTLLFSKYPPACAVRGVGDALLHSVSPSVSLQETSADGVCFYQARSVGLLRRQVLA